MNKPLYINRLQTIRERGIMNIFVYEFFFTEMCLFYSKIKAFFLDKQNTNNLIAAIVTHKKV